MRAPRYPLEPLVELREAQVDAAVRGLASAVAGREAAERERCAARSRQQAHEAGAAGVRGGEEAALTRGELSAADLARAHAWEIRVVSERQAIAADLERARVTEVGAREAESAAQGEVATRKAGAEVVAADEARWRGAVRKKAEAREEEEAEEAFRSRQ